jgi:hypothetical protein
VAIPKAVVMIAVTAIFLSRSKFMQPSNPNVERFILIEKQAFKLPVA